MAKTPSPLPPVGAHPEDEPLVCLQINEQWIPYIIGALWPMKFPEFWAGTLDENRNVRRDAINLILIFEKAMEDCGMSNGCCDGSDLLITVITRVTVNGQIQISIDNGQTWHDSPTDPRVTMPSLPPPVGVNVADKCNAASNALEAVKAYVEDISNRIDTFTTLETIVLEIAGAAMAAILVALGQDKLATMVEAAIQTAVALIGHSKAEWDAIWTQEAYDAVLCLFFCNITSDGTFTEQGWANCINQAMSKLPTTGAISGGVAYQIHELLRIWGLNGLNRAAAIGAAATGDCSDCACGCSLDNWVITCGTLVSRTATEIVVQSVQIDGSWVAEIKSPSDASCCNPIGILSSENNDHSSRQGNLCGIAYPGDFPQALSGGAGQCWNAAMQFGLAGVPIGQVTFTSGDDCIE